VTTNPAFPAAANQLQNNGRETPPLEDIKTHRIASQVAKTHPHTPLAVVLRDMMHRREKQQIHAPTANTSPSFPSNFADWGGLFK
jgi:hypothetical protein